MAALVRHDAIASRPPLDWILADESAGTNPCSSQGEPSVGILPDVAGIRRSYDLVGRAAQPKTAESRFPAPAYVHHVPGRLRVQAAEFRYNPSLLEAARRELSALGGVGTVSTNLVTGSILVEYDPLVSTPAALCEAMQKRGFPVIRLEAAAHDTARPTALAESFAGIAIRTLVELLAERLFVAVIAAMI
jgi:copper chaperone CopZ